MISSKNIFLIVFIFYSQLAFTQHEDSSCAQQSFHFKDLVKIFSSQGKISPLTNRYSQLGNEVNNANYILDGQVSARYHLIDSYDYKWNPWFFPIFDMGRFNKLMLEMNMDVGIRMFHEVSSPVRTSYRPGIKIYWTPIEGKSYSMGDDEVHVFTLSLFHYSNGQNGETLAKNAFRNNPETQFDTLLNQINSNHIFNRFNGSYSSNYSTLGYEYFRLINPHVIFKASLEYQFIFPIWAFEKELEPYFSRNNISLDVSCLWVKKHRQRHLEKYRLNFYCKYALGDNSALNPELNPILTDLNISSTLYIRLPATAHAAFFIDAGYSGSDGHNIYLEDRNLYARVGLASGNFLYKEFDSSAFIEYR